MSSGPLPGNKTKDLSVLPDPSSSRKPLITGQGTPVLQCANDINFISQSTSSLQVNGQIVSLTPKDEAEGEDLQFTALGLIVRHLETVYRFCERWYGKTKATLHGD